MEFDLYPGWELVSGDPRRAPYWRRIAPNWQNPSPAQEECRRKFGEFASQTKGLTGTTPLPDGRILSASAVEISKALAPKSCIEPTETEAAAPHNESTSTDHPIETIFMATSTLAEPSGIAPLISLYRDVEEIRAMKRRGDEAVLQRFNSDLRTERERLKTNFEKSKATIEERRRGNEALLREFVDAPHAKTDNVMRSRLQIQIKKTQSKHEVTIPPIPVPASFSSLPAVSAAPPTKPADDFDPISFFGWTLGAISAVGLIAWGMKSKDNTATALDIVHAMNAILNPGRPSPPFNKP